MDEEERYLGVAERAPNLDVSPVSQPDRELCFFPGSRLADVTPPTVKTRVDDLVKEGVITGFTVQVDEEKLTRAEFLDVLLVLTAPRKVGEVSEAMKRTGATAAYKTADSKVIARVKGLIDKLKEHIDKVPEGVKRYGTTLITDERREKQLLQR